MAKPPPDVDPEKFVIGKGLYSSESAFRLVGDQTTFRIEPAPPSIAGIAVFDLVILAAAVALFRLIDEPGNSFLDEPWIRYSPLVVGLLTCIVATIVPWSIWRSEGRRGTLFVYDKRDGAVRLPREGEAFARGEIVHLQHVTTKDLRWGGVCNNERRTELNLVTSRGAIRRRWAVVRSTSPLGAPFIQAILAHTDLPIVRITDSDWGWETTEKPHRRVVPSRLPGDVSDGSAPVMPPEEDAL
jgi:hypothetical protein